MPCLLVQLLLQVPMSAGIPRFFLMAERGVCGGLNSCGKMFQRAETLAEKDFFLYPTS